MNKTGLDWFDKLVAGGLVPIDQNLRGVAMLCVHCDLRDNKKTIAPFVIEGMSLCKEHMGLMIKSLS